LRVIYIINWKSRCAEAKLFYLKNKEVDRFLLHEQVDFRYRRTLSRGQASSRFPCSCASSSQKLISLRSVQGLDLLANPLGVAAFRSNQ